MVKDRNIKDFDSNLLKCTKICTKALIFITLDTSPLKKIDDYENIYGLNPLCLITDKAGGHIQEKNECKYLVFDSTDESSEVLKKYKKF